MLGGQWPELTLTGRLALAAGGGKTEEQRQSIGPGRRGCNYPGERCWRQVCNGVTSKIHVKAETTGLLTEWLHGDRKRKKTPRWSPGFWPETPEGGSWRYLRRESQSGIRSGERGEELGVVAQ